MEQKQKSLKKNSFFNYLQTFMGLIMPIITFPYASRIMMPEGLGKVNFSHSVVSYFSMLAGLGIYSYALRESSKIRDDKEAFSKFCKEVFIINLISTLVSYILLFVSLVFIKKLHSYTILILICSTTILLTTMGLSWVYAAKEEFKYTAIVTCLFQALSLIYLFVFVKSEKDIIPYTIFGMLASTCVNFCNFIFSGKLIDWKYKCQLEFRKHLKPIFTLFAMVIAQSIYLILDATILGFISGDEAVGYYHAATKINKMVLGIIASLSSVLVPRLSYYLENDKEKYYSLLEKSFNIISIMAIPSTIGFLILSKPIMLIFCGEKYLNAITPMNIITPIILIINISYFYNGQIFLAFRKDKYSLITVSIGAVINLILNLILIPKYSYNGAAIGTLVAESIITIISICLGCKLIPNIMKFYKYYYQYIISAAVMGVAVYFINKYLPLHILSLFISILTGMLVYYISLISFRNTYLVYYSKLYFEKIKNRISRSKTKEN